MRQARRFSLVQDDVFKHGCPFCYRLSKREVDLMRVIYRDGCRTPEDSCDGCAMSGLASRMKSEKDEPSHPAALIGQTASLAGSATGLQCAGNHRQHQVSGMPASGGGPGGAGDRGLARSSLAPCPSSPSPQSA